MRRAVGRERSRVAVDPVTECLEVGGTSVVGDGPERPRPQFVVQRNGDASLVLVVCRMLVVQLDVVASGSDVFESTDVDEDANHLRT